MTNQILKNEYIRLCVSNNLILGEQKTCRICNDDTLDTENLQSKIINNDVIRSTYNCVLKSLYQTREPA